MTETPELSSNLKELNRRLEMKYQAGVLIFCSILLLVALLLHIDHDGHVSTPFLNWATPGMCWFRSTTGIDCPGCGMTRSFVSLGDGRFVDAVRFNWAGILIFLAIAFQIPYRLLQIKRLREGKKLLNIMKFGTGFLIFTAVVAFAHWILKITGVV